MPFESISFADDNSMSDESAKKSSEGFIYNPGEKKKINYCIKLRQIANSAEFDVDFGTHRANDGRNVLIFDYLVTLGYTHDDIREMIRRYLLYIQPFQIQIYDAGETDGNLRCVLDIGYKTPVYIKFDNDKKYIVSFHLSLPKGNNKNFKIEDDDNSILLITNTHHVIEGDIIDIPIPKGDTVIDISFGVVKFADHKSGFTVIRGLVYEYQDTILNYLQSRLDSIADVYFDDNDTTMIVSDINEHSYPAFFSDLVRHHTSNILTIIENIMENTSDTWYRREKTIALGDYCYYLSSEFTSKEMSEELQNIITFINRWCYATNNVRLHRFAKYCEFTLSDKLASDGMIPELP